MLLRFKITDSPIAPVIYLGSHINFRAKGYVRRPKKARFSANGERIIRNTSKGRSVDQSARPLDDRLRIDLRARNAVRSPTEDEEGGTFQSDRLRAIPVR